MAVRPLLAHELSVIPGSFPARSFENRKHFRTPFVGVLGAEILSVSPYT